jgi:hypothetical protein
MAQDQESQLHAEGRQRRPIRPVTAVLMEAGRRSVRTGPIIAKRCPLNFEQARSQWEVEKKKFLGANFGCLRDVSPAVLSIGAQPGPRRNWPYYFDTATEIGPEEGSRSAPIGTPSRHPFCRYFNAFPTFGVGSRLGAETHERLLRRWREVANRHVVDHPSTQRGHLSHHTISFLRIGSGQPQSSQTGAASRQAHSPPAQAGSLCAGHAQ